jgi:membrane protease YdiL (CAAX protease family)
LVYGFIESGQESKTKDNLMIILITIFLISLSIVAIFQIRKLSDRVNVSLHKNVQINQAIKFQVAQLLLALVVLGITYLLNPEDFLRFFRIGDLQTHIGKIGWLGITGNESWLEIALSIGVFITLGTGLFMFFQLKKLKTKFYLDLSLFKWVILFSAMNAFSEEAIFRVGIVSPLLDQLSIPAILIISAVMFGLPHYFGQPSGIIGVIMAGFLGWFLAMSLVETQGVFIAWTIHFVQDVVIISSLFMINRSKNALITN